MDNQIAVENTGNKTYVWLVSIVAAVGGFVFGFDTGIISGAMPSLEEYFSMDAEQLGFSVAIVFIGCILGALTGGFFSDRYGRKRVLIGTAILFCMSAILTAIPQSVGAFNFARFVGGLAIGVSMPISGIYLAEVAPARIRGRVVTMNQLAITFGILISYVAGWYFGGIGTEQWQLASSWRWMFGSEAVPAAFFIFVLFFIPESPRWLIKQGEYDRAYAILAKVDGAHQAHAEVEEIKKTIAEEEVSVLQLFHPGIRVAMIIGVFLCLFDQITGINIVIYYIQKILLDLDFSKEQARQGMVWLGVSNFVTTIIALFVLDRIGRKPLLMFCPLGMALAMFVIGWDFYSDIMSSKIVLAAIVAYCFFYALGVGPGILLVLSEIFPTRIRGKAVGACTIFMWVSCYFVSKYFPELLEWSQAWTFWSLTCTSLLLFLFVWRVIPETKGRTLEEIERYWRRK